MQHNQVEFTPRMQGFFNICKLIKGTLKSLLQHHNSKATNLWHSAFFMVQLSHPYITTGKTTALIRQTFVGKVMSLLFSILFSLVITFLPRSKRLWMWTIDFSVRFSSLSQSCSTLCDPMNCSMPGLPVLLILKWKWLFWWCPVKTSRHDNYKGNEKCK